MDTNSDETGDADTIDEQQLGIGMAIESGIGVAIGVELSDW